MVANPLPPAEQLDPELHDRVLAAGLERGRARRGGRQGRDPVPARPTSTARQAAPASRPTCGSCSATPSWPRGWRPLSARHDAGRRARRRHGRRRHAAVAARSLRAATPRRGSPSRAAGRLPTRRRGWPWPARRCARGARRRGRGGRAAPVALEALGVEARVIVDGERPTGHVRRARCGRRRADDVPRCGGKRRARSRPTCQVTCSSPGRHLHVAGYALLRDGSRAAALSADRARRRGRHERVGRSRPRRRCWAAGFPRAGPRGRACCCRTPRGARADGLGDPAAAARALAERFRRWWSRSGRRARCGRTAAIEVSRRRRAGAAVRRYDRRR